MTSETQVDEAFELISGLIMEDGDRWGDIATDWQVEHVLAVLRGDWLWFFLNLPRGASKTTDLAAIVLAFLLVLLRDGGRAYGFARDRDQAKLLVKEIDGFVRRTPNLDRLVQVSMLTATAVETGAVFEAQEADAASAHGLRAELFIVDEIARWPDSENARGVWAAILGSVMKRADARLVVISAASTLSHWSYTDVLQVARADPAWFVRELSGPTPWLNPARLESLRALLGDAEFDRQVLNRWTELDTVATTREAVEACRRESGALEPVSGRYYVHGVDLSMTNDYTVVATCHREDRDGAEVIVVDRVRTWKPSRANPIDQDEVEAYVLTTARRYRGRVNIDIYQAAGIHQALRKQGIAASEKAEMTAGANSKRALALNRLLQDRRLEIPGDDPELVDELATLAFKETTPGVYRMESTRSGQGHHDRATAISFAALDLLERGAGPQLVVFDDEPVRDPLNRPEDLLADHGVFASATLGVAQINGEPVDVEELPVGGQPSPFAPSGSGAAAEVLPPGAQRSPWAPPPPGGGAA